MVLETEPVAFSQWIGPALVFFLEAGLLLGLLALVVGYLIAAFRYGPLRGGDITFHVVKGAAIDLISLSPRRIAALARLAVHESMRRLTVAFSVFLLILLFAGWFLDTSSNDPSTLYVSFVLTATTYLVLLMALFMSAFSLPTDIKNHTIYTVVTKPVRAGEIVLGRIVGFTLIGTVLLAVMGLFSYVFVVRLLNHTHEIDLASIKPAASRTESQVTTRTTSAQDHRHQVVLTPGKDVDTAMSHGHWHHVTTHTDGGGKTTYAMGPPEGIFVARVPVYGKLRFKDRAGTAAARGINVGNEWMYRSFIEGGTLAAAVWKFHDITPERFPQGLPLEMTIRVFRTYKGNIEKGILGSVVLKNPRTGRSSHIETFRAKDVTIDHRFFERKLQDTTGKPIDLFDDLVDNGEIEVWLQCLEPAQYYGLAQPDVYLRAHDGTFTMNFVKAYLAIWLQMLLVTGIGVMFSTFLSGPVAMLATLAAIVLGFCTQFVLDVASGAIKGGGPIESLIRLVQQRNVVIELEPGLTLDVVQSVDGMLMMLMTAAAKLIPNFLKFTNVDYLAHGFNIPVDRVLVQTVSGLAYVVVVFVVGYFFLKTREVAR